MAGVATVVERIRTDLNRGIDYDDRIRRALLSAVQFYRSRRFAFNQTRGVTAATAEFSSLGSDWVQIDSLRLGYSGGYYALRKTNWGELEERSTSPTNTGPPVCYAIQGRRLRYYPIPDQSYSVAITYITDLWSGITSLSDSLSTAWLTEGEEMIRLHAMVEILQVYRQSQEDSMKASELQNREQVVYRELRARASEEVGSGMIQAFL
jgi:hypothetical protein